MEKSYFVKIFGNTPAIRLLDFMLCEGRYFDYTLSEIAKHSKIGWTTLHRILPELEEAGIIIKTRKVGRATLYKLNLSSEIVQGLIELDNKIRKHFSEQIVKEELRQTK